MQAAFRLADVQLAAQDILRCQPDPVPSYRLLREVLRKPWNDPQLQEAYAALQHSKWVRQLADAQLPDGSWGRFHSQDTSQKTVFRTTELAIDRAFSLGLAPSHAVLNRARQYIERVLGGQARITDPDEHNDAWPLLIKVILAGKLAEIDPTSPALVPHWEYMLQVARQAFSSGSYRLADELRAYLQLSGVHPPRSFLQSRYAIALLSAQPLPLIIERHLLGWIWNKPDGIGYLVVPLSAPTPRLMSYWLKSIHLLSRFPSWPTVSVATLNRLWGQRDEQGWWDFGPQSAMCVDFPISENWRRGINRKVDFSTCLLSVLRKYFD